MNGFANKTNMLRQTVLLACACAITLVRASPVEAKCYDMKARDLSGKRALIIVTSHDKIGPENCTLCDPTGVYGEELTAPYSIFKGSNMSTTIASIEGGDVPIDPTYNTTLLRTSWDKRFFGSAEAYADSHNTSSFRDLEPTSFDIIFMAGGWGAAWDFGQSAELGAFISKAYAAGKVVGSVCHGALGFIQARKPDGSLLCEGTKMTGVTDREIEQLRIAKVTPMHPEDELKKAGADYQSKHGLVTDLMENLVVQDGNVITGQNQMAACQVPQLMMQRLSELARAERSERSVVM